MRICLAFLLALLLSLNTASAAVAGICDALEHTPSHAAHVGHHSHEHSGDHLHDDLPVASDHHHAHAHPGFLSLLSDAMDMKLPAGSSPLVEPPTDRFVSASLAGLDRPPRAALA